MAPYIFKTTRDDGRITEHDCYDHALLAAAGRPIEVRTEYAPDDEMVPVITDIETLRVKNTWTDDHILCCTVLINDGLDTEREQEIWWCDWEGVAAFSYYMDSGKARDHVHGYGLLVSDLFDKDYDPDAEEHANVDQEVDYSALVDETQAEILRDHAEHAAAYEKAHPAD